jgi:hypothetical protein
MTNPAMAMPPPVSSSARVETLMSRLGDPTTAALLTAMATALEMETV